MMPYTTSNAEPETKVVWKKEAAPLVTCPICFRIQENSTTIIECMHSFCKKCITKKLKEEKQRCCPVCYAYLGCTPLDKLRSDNNLQTLAKTLFPSKNKKTKKPDVSIEDEGAIMPSIPIPAKKKTRSLSSFTNTSKETCETVPNGKRKAVPKKFLSFVTNEEAIRKVEDRPESSTARKNARKRKQLNLSQCSKKQDSRDDGPRNVRDLNILGNKPSSKGIVFKTPKSRIPKEKPNFSKGKGKECVDASNYVDLVDTDDDEEEAEAEDYVLKSSSQGIVLGTSQSTTAKDKPSFSKAKGKECGNTSNYVNDDDEEEDPTPTLAPSDSVTVKRKGQGRPKGAGAISEGVRVDAQAIVDANGSERIPNSVWLSLVATYKQDVGPPLPQIPTSYLRIKDVRLTVSFLKKYLVHKLNLQTEDEVEIELLGRPLPSSMELYMLIKMWGREVASESITTSIGSSARDFVMLLSYSRKALICS